MEKIIDGIYYCGVADANRKFFDELIPLSKGTSYNSYYVQGTEKSALIDTSYPPQAEVFLEQIKDIKSLDYIVIDHGEQDHTGCIPLVLEKFPNAKILTNAKCKPILTDAINIAESAFQLVADGEEISLGGKTLKFIHAPWVHWPDTMFTYIPEDNILFTTDFLGAHTSFNEIYSRDDETTLKYAKRYYAEIMMPFRSFCIKYLKKIRELNPRMILPSHGGAYKNPNFILDAYEKWTGETQERKILIPCVSMYGNTYNIAKILKDELEKKKIEVHLIDAVNGDLGEIAEHMVDAGGIIFAVPMVLTGPHPVGAYIAYLTNLLKPKARYYGVVGSYGWGGNLTSKLSDMLTNIKPEILGDVLVKGKPEEIDILAIKGLVEKFSEKL